MDCPQNAAYRDFVPFRVICMYTVVISMSAVMFIFKVYILSFIIRDIWVGAFFIRILYTYSSKHPCDFNFSLWECYFWRHPSFMMMLFISLLQLAMSYERFVSLQQQNYEKSGSRLGYLLVVIAFLMAEAFTLNVQWVFPLTGETAYCSRSVVFKNTTSWLGGNSLYNVTGVSAELVSLLIVLWIYINTYKQKTYCEKLSVSLSDKFEKCRTRNVLSGILPVFLMHSFFSIATHLSEFIIGLNKNILATVPFATLQAFTNFTPLYTLLAPILLWWLQKKKRPEIQKTATQDDYFKNYEKMW